jgi:hypothetical protein
MASRRDQAPSPAHDEQSPLLGDSQRPIDDEEEAHAVQSDPPSEDKPRYRYAWRIFWVVVAIFILVIFTKAWIDAKDTDVSASNRKPGII